MELKTTKAQLAKYFSAWVQWWINKNHYTQLQAAVRLDVTPGFINMIINNKRAASATQMEKIAKVANLDLLDILNHGRDILTGESRSGSSPASSEAYALESGLGLNQIDSLREYRALLLVGGEGVEVITESIHALATKRSAPDRKKHETSVTLHDRSILSE